MRETTVLAVYGTLRKGYGMFLESSARFIGTFKTKEMYKMYNLGSFPGIEEYANGYSYYDQEQEAKRKGYGAIVVDVFEVSAEVLRKCDRYEGIGSNLGIYKRARCKFPKDIERKIIENANIDSHYDIECYKMVDDYINRIKGRIRTTQIEGGDYLKFLENEKYNLGV